MIAKLKVNDYIYIALISILTISGFVMGIVFIYFSNIRELSNDITRIQRINSLNYSITNYYSSNNQLPKDLDSLKNSSYSYYGDDIYNDPKNSSKKFEYKRGDGRMYKICAEFEAGTDELNKYFNYREGDNDYSYSYLATLESDFRKYHADGEFEFEKGYQCLDFEAEQNSWDR